VTFSYKNILYQNIKSQLIEEETLSHTINNKDFTYTIEASWADLGDKELRKCVISYTIPDSGTSLNLVNGWNLISVSSGMVNKSVADVFGDSVKGSAWYWEDGIFKVTTYFRQEKVIGFIHLLAASRNFSKSAFG